MADDYAPRIKVILAENGCTFVRQGKGDHEIWESPITKRRFMVDGFIKSRHIAVVAIFARADENAQFSIPVNAIALQKIDITDMPSIRAQADRHAQLFRIVQPVSLHPAYCLRRGNVAIGADQQFEKPAVAMPRRNPWQIMTFDESQKNLHGCH